MLANLKREGRYRKTKCWATKGVNKKFTLLPANSFADTAGNNDRDNDTSSNFLVILTFLSENRSTVYLLHKHRRKANLF